MSATAIPIFVQALSSSSRSEAGVRGANNR
jgi:hypothetical protein